MESRHHIIPRSKSGTDHINNIVLLEDKFHRRLHNLFGNKLPHEQIHTIISIARTALVPEFRQSLMDVIEGHEGEHYKKDTYNKKSGIWIPNT